MWFVKILIVVIDKIIRLLYTRIVVFNEGEMAVARQPKKAAEGETVKRTVMLPGSLYNRLIELAAKERRDVNAQIVVVIEDSLERSEKSDKEKGQLVAELLAA